MKKKISRLFDYSLLRTMCAIAAPSGNEAAMTTFLLKYIRENSKKWRHKVKVLHGPDWHDNIILVFGRPRTAIFAHIDSIGFTVRYGRQLVKIGGPVVDNGIRLVGSDSHGSQVVELVNHTDKKTKIKSLQYSGKRDFDRGTELTFKPHWREDESSVQCCYMDNRLGVFSALHVAETLKDGVIVFSTYEEHGGGSVPYIQRYLHRKLGISQALISDISWISDGVFPGKGPVISLRDSLIPRRSYVNRIIALAQKGGCRFQLEVEGSGGSDARELQMSDNPWDWCFVGAAEENVHSPDEKVNKKDIEDMVRLYEVLMKGL
jgi:putative aminopeptidase FrvX